MPPQLTPPVKSIQGVRLAGTTSDPESTWDINIEYLADSTSGVIASITPNLTSNPPTDCLALPALVHPHIHLDKAFIHSTPQYAHLLPSTGTFQEALTSTTQAKKQFTPPDLLKRGEWLLAESVASGVTAMRAFIEVDHTVQHTCLEAGLTLKDKWKDACEIQLVAFAQDPIFSTEHGDENRRLIEAAIKDYTSDQLSVLGTTPYVETNIDVAKKNIEWAVEMALQTDRHLDFHLDYNLDQDSEPLIWHVLRTLREKQWTSTTTDKRIMLGHCTRLSLFSEEEWDCLAREIHNHDIPVSFVGLPTSDLYMASAPPTHTDDGSKLNPRGTLPIPDIIRKYGIDAVMGVNNVGNAFTPWGTSDPLSLACFGVGVYQAGTVADAELLYECVSTRARAAIGLASRRPDLSVRVECGDCADFLLLCDVDDTGCLEGSAGRPRKSVAEVVWDPPGRVSRVVLSRGRVKMPALSASSDIALRFVE